ILAKQSPNSVWFLSANLVIAKGATFHIDSTDTKWLKISSKVTRTGVAKIAPARTGVFHVYFGLYTFGVGHMIIENNIIRNSGHYGLDPHTGTHAMIIRNNTVYDNKGGSGIICSLNCYNILIENNKVHDNAGDGIDFSRNMYNSIARNNIVYNEHIGVTVSQSHNNQIYNNTISKSGDGINV